MTVQAIDEKEARRRADFILREQTTVVQVTDEAGRTWWHCMVDEPTVADLPHLGRVYWPRGCGLTLEGMLQDVELGAKHRADDRRARRRSRIVER